MFLRYWIFRNECRYGNHRVLKVDAPIVEGSFIAAVKLSIGGSIDDALAEIKQSF